VTVFDPNFEPYTATGRAETGGAVIVFDQPPVPVPAAPKPLLPPDPGPPLETAAGAVAVTAPRAADLPAAQTLDLRVQSEPAVDEPNQEPNAGSDYVDGIYAVNPDYLLSYPQNAYRILSAPFYFDRSDWFTAALVLGTTGVLIALDDPLMDFWQNDVKSGFTGDVADIVREAGERTDILLGTVVGYLVAETVDSTGIMDAKRGKSAALLSLESFALTHGLVSGLKFLTGRGRPDSTDDTGDFSGPARGDVNASFPSGHAAGAFAVASALAETYGEEYPWSPYLLYTLATGVGLARIDDNRHWFSDVFFSGALGYFIGKTVTRYSPFLQENNISVEPFADRNTQGISLNYRF